jgi:hypothetical protein
VDETGKVLYLLASEQRSTSGMAELLRDYGAFTRVRPVRTGYALSSMHINSKRNQSNHWLRCRVGHLVL